MRLPRLAPLVLAASVGLAACSVGGDGDDVRVSFSADDSARAPVLGDGDVAVTSTDGAVVLALVGDTVRMQLSDSLRQHVRATVDSEVGQEAGAIGGAIAKAVGKTVAGAMGFVVRVPVDEVENVRYEDNRIRFETRHNTKFSMGGPRHGDDGDGRENGAQFSEADGRRFVEAVKARQGARRGNL
jgi:hypothetical protein